VRLASGITFMSLVDPTGQLFSKHPATIEPISPELIQDVCARLVQNKPVRQKLPGGGTLNIDRLLPFLCVYRRNPARLDVGTELFVISEAAYLCATGEAPSRPGLRQLVRRIADTASAQFGAFLLLEVWSSDDQRVPRARDELTGELLLPAPAFAIVTRATHRPEETVAKLALSLGRIKANGQTARVDITRHARNHPPGMTQLISVADAVRMNCHVLGVEVQPIFRHAEAAELYDSVHRRLRRSVTRALKQSFFVFALNHTNVRPQHYYVLGRKSLPKRVWMVDRQLAEVSAQFKFLLLVTPINAERSWHEFMQGGYQKEPTFQYRPLGTDPLLLKRRLMRIPTERVEDPALAHLLRQTQDELDRQLTMLADIGTSRFRPGSVQVYGGVDGPLLRVASEILANLPPVEESNHTVDARGFARVARREIQFYRRQSPTFTAEAMVRNDIYSGLLAAGGNLIIGRETTVKARRVEALLHHEIGTHLLTYYNGQAQPLRLLKVGLAGYDVMQEGLAVLSEYLVGGLSRARLRTLAARVVATDHMLCGATFQDTFRLLVDQHGFEPYAAFTITLRVYRGGGLTKDAVYLRGVLDIMQYIRRGGELEPLFIGKLAADHVPIVRELSLRGVLRPLPLRPRYLDDPRAAERLARLRQGLGVLDLVD
jgi:uncharacterized protein (TIGR02421 family)